MKKKIDIQLNLIGKGNPCRQCRYEHVETHDVPCRLCRWIEREDLWTPKLNVKNVRVLVFQNQFSDRVRRGEKLQTIRATARCKPGDELSLRRWTGRPYRSKQETLRETKCAAVLPIRITTQGIHVEGCSTNRDRMAAADGFRNWREMRDWFGAVHGLPFSGFLISWPTLKLTGGLPTKEA